MVSLLGNTSKTIKPVLAYGEFCQLQTDSNKPRTSCVQSFAKTIRFGRTKQSVKNSCKNRAYIENKNKALLEKN